MKRFLFSVITVFSLITLVAQPKHEIRAVWLTTNSGSDWPKSIYDVSKQKENLCKILDLLCEANFNTIIFQAQVKGDVAWTSTIQPAMRAITGDGSKSLSYDVSEFVIEECHKRNLECHAWIVPYRVGSQSEANKYASNAVKHVTVQHPELCVLYNSAYYLDPGIPATREYLLDLYKELISNYDFDGVNFDYTRYPGSDFDDAASYSTYNPDALPKDDWRRQNINTFIAEFYEMAKSINPNIKVGAAPIGTYKNVPGYGNMTAYGSVYQDACQWMQSGNHDLLIPQMYWNETYGFSPNMTTWVNNCDGRQIVVGLAPYKMTDSNNWDVSVITDQIEKVRAKDGMSGVCFFRTDHVIDQTSDKVSELYDELQTNYFKYPAHIVPMDYNGITEPNSPINVSQEYVGGEYIIKWEEPELDTENTPIKYYSIYLSDGINVDLNDHQQVVAYKVNDTEYRYASTDQSLRFAVTAFDQNYYESEATIAEISSVEELEYGTYDLFFHSGQLNVSSPLQINSVEIYAIYGSKLMFVPSSQNSMSIDCNSLSQGVYVAKINLSNGVSFVEKFIK